MADSSDVKDSNGTTDAAPQAEEQTKTQIENAARDHLISQTHSIILPSYSTWFDMHQINQIERKALPEFFNNRNRSKTPAVYKDYRDFMINTYRINPVEYLTVTACRRNLAGDVCAIMRVHAFLEQWGLINYQVEADARPSNVGPPFTGHFRVIADTPRGLQPWNPAADPVVTQGKPHADTEAKAKPQKIERNLEIGRNVYEANGKKVTPTTDDKQTNGETKEGPSTNGTPDPSKALEGLGKDKQPIEKVHCYSCGVDCTRIYYHNGKGATPGAKSKYDVCPNCFLEMRLPANQDSSLYVKMENPGYSKYPDKDAPWTDAELLLLLEGLEKFDESWSEIAEYVGTRTREECVIKFLQLEIEDKYLDSEPVNGTASGATSLGLLGPAGGLTPFTQADNPVLSVIAYLAQMTDPAVAAAAAGKSVDVMKKQLRKQLDKDYVSGEASDTKEQDGDSMDVDVVHHQTTTTTTTTTTSSTTLAQFSAIPMAGTAARAASLASHEEREMTRLVSAAVNTELARMQLKLQQFEEMERLIQAERRELERAKRELFLERLAFRKRVRNVQEGFRSAAQGVPGAMEDVQSLLNAKGEGFTLVHPGQGDGALMPPSAQGAEVKSFEI
jgi:SWI/SNF related-matrix-associated actin-dependent regulator of chromatin subfamily C